MAVTNEEIVRTVRDSINTLLMARLCLYTGREQAVEYDYPFYFDISYIIGSYVKVISQFREQAVGLSLVTTSCKVSNGLLVIGLYPQHICQPYVYTVSNHRNTVVT